MIDLKSLHAVLEPLVPKAEPDPAEIARQQLAEIRAERARREAELAAKAPKPTAPIVEQVQARVERDRDEIRDKLDEQNAEQGSGDSLNYLCRRRLSFFVKMAWAALHPGEVLEWSHHHDALCDHVQWLLEGWMRKKADPSYVQPYRQMVVNLPPTTLKTELLMVFAPAWMWLRWPAWRVLCLSCNPRVALDSAAASRRVIESPWYQQTFRPDWTLLDDQNAKSDFGTTMGGKRQSHGMSAAVVGEHADAIFVDDPTDPKEVTRAALEKANHDWPGVRNRVTDERSSIRVIVQQRLDVDDLSGFVTRGKKGRAWVRVVMPMEFVSSRRCTTPMPVDANNRLALDGSTAIATWSDWRAREGELIQPSRYPEDILEELRLNAGPYGWSSQYQQDPVPRDGGRVKRSWLHYFRLGDFHAGDHRRPEGTGIDKDGNPTPPRVIPRLPGGTWDLDFLYLSVDPASKKTDSGSLWGLLAVGGKGARRFIMDDRSKRGEPDEALQIIRDMVKTWRPSRLLIEDTAAGPTLIKTLTDELGAGKIRGSDGRPIICKVQALTPAEVGGDKEARLAGVINQLAAGLVYLLEGAPWLADFVDELTMFPNWPTKDRVDALTALLAITRAEDALWPEVKAERERLEAESRGEKVEEPPSMAAKLNSLWLGVPVPGKPRDVATGKPPRECQHEWIDGICRICKQPPKR